MRVTKSANEINVIFRDFRTKSPIPIHKFLLRPDQHPHALPNKYPNAFPHHSRVLVAYRDREKSTNAINRVVVVRVTGDSPRVRFRHE